MTPMMQVRSYVMGCIVAVATGSAMAQGTHGSAQQTRTPVMVELFTSEGCSSCPPADALLARLEREQPVGSAEVIVLEEHVDYWENLGWHDRFSSREFTERQTRYGPRLRFDDVYTPQMVVDGSAQFVGNDGRQAVQVITEAAHKPKVALAVSEPVVDGRRLAFTVSAPGGIAGVPAAELFAAVVQTAATTDVRGGENGGRRLEHVAVVRSLKRIGKVQDLGSGELRFGVEAPADAAAAKMRVVVFAQGSNQGAVYGAATAAVRR